MADEPQKRNLYNIHPGVVRSYSKFYLSCYFGIKVKHHRNHYRDQFFIYCFNSLFSTHW